MNRLGVTKRLLSLDRALSARAMSSGNISQVLNKLSLTPRFADEDIKLLKRTAPKFKNFLRSIKDKKGGENGGDEIGEIKDMVDSDVNAHSAGLQSITSLSSAQKFDLTINLQGNAECSITCSGIYGPFPSFTAFNIQGPINTNSREGFN